MAGTITMSQAAVVAGLPYGTLIQRVRLGIVPSVRLRLERYHGRGRFMRQRVLKSALPQLVRERNLRESTVNWMTPKEYGRRYGYSTIYVNRLVREGVRVEAVLLPNRRQMIRPLPPKPVRSDRAERVA